MPSKASCLKDNLISNLQLGQTIILVPIVLCILGYILRDILRKNPMWMDSMFLRILLHITIKMWMKFLVLMSKIVFLFQGTAFIFTSGTLIFLLQNVFLFHSDY